MGSSNRLNRTELISILAFWGFIATLTFLNALLNDSAATGGNRLPPVAPLLAALIDSFIWACITPIIFKLTSRFSLDRPKWLLSLSIFLALGIVISILVARFIAYVRYEQSIYFNPSLSPSGQALGPFNPSVVSRRNWFMNEYFIYLVILAASYAHDYFVRYHLRKDEALKLETQAMQLRAELAETRLELLRSQLDPHFLFNTLNTVSSLVDSNPRGARRMISQLSSLLRSYLEDKDREVTLARELEFLRRYLDIMQTRFEGRITIVEQIAIDTYPALVPTMILQPLVENAIKHGIAKLDGVGKIEICAKHDRGQLHISIADNGKADIQQLLEERTSTGIGLRNTRARLAQSYGEQQSLTVSHNDTSGITVNVSIPFHTQMKHAIA